EIERVVMDQLKLNLSIYDCSGIFKEFEQRFAKYHGMQHALLSNSGTSAIFSMFEGINLQPGDEVICPTYTFYATASPLTYTGAVPVFCDCLSDGNINPAEIKRNTTSRTKAVIVTHMWGIPCEMDDIVSICKENQLLLLEDCSHAHGASYKGQRVGTFGDAAAWSLQGQKIVSGGEGGIMLTNNDEVFYRALLQGHDNKRCKQQIPSDHPLSRFSLTGFGLKFRAHPLAIAIANEQFSHLDEWLDQKQIFASLFESEWQKYPFLRMPKYPNRQPSWYAFVMQFDDKHSNGVSIEQFTRALLAEGLVEVDRPGSTCPCHDLPLFTDPQKAMSRLYDQRQSQCGLFGEASAFYQNAIKLPVWAFSKDKDVVDKYTEGFHKVCQAVLDTPEVFLN
ncbi:MAG: aminotransferase class I/II-fold pyridoxal phosphate-dependent enzyme, partial [Candidatus Andersenbacteria bacterium]